MIKVCGIRSVEEAKELKDLDVDYFGLIFAKSVRRVDVETAKNIRDIFKKAGKKIVGVFTDEMELDAVKDKIDLDVYQLHGEFGNSSCISLLSGGKEVWRVFSVSDSLPEFGNFENLLKKEKFFPLFDTFGKKRGGNGVAFNHKILRDLPPFSFIIAGGLSEENCLEANSYKPYVLDFNSKVETGDKKDKQKIENIIDILKGEVNGTLNQSSKGGSNIKK